MCQGSPATSDSVRTLYARIPKRSEFRLHEAMDTASMETNSEVVGMQSTRDTAPKNRKG